MSEPVGRPADLHDEVQAALGARRDLGVDYEDAIAASLAERVEELVAQRASATAVSDADREHDRTEDKATGDGRFVIALVSLGAAIPITGIVHDSVVGTAIAYAGLVGINAAAAIRGRRRH